jgi:ubiquinone/menaquinone biosynthesis C-methylase UbiE
LLSSRCLSSSNLACGNSTTVDSTFDNCITVSYNIQRAFHVWEGEGHTSSYYRGRQARHYNRGWRTYTEKTLTVALAMIDFAALQRVPEELGRPPRVLDVACGTGILLRHLLERVPGMEAYGVDASEDMLAQAREALKDQPHVRLEQVEVNDSRTTGLPYPPNTFDLVTCTNALHDIGDPRAFLSDVRGLLAPGGQLVLEDFARRGSAWLWAVFEWLLRWVEKGQVRAYTLAEAQALCVRAGLHVVYGKAFPVDWFWHGWALRAD